MCLISPSLPFLLCQSNISVFFIFSVSPINYQLISFIFWNTCIHVPCLYSLLYVLGSLSLSQKLGLLYKRMSLVLSFSTSSIIVTTAPFDWFAFQVSLRCQNSFYYFPWLVNRASHHSPIVPSQHPRWLRFKFLGGHSQDS